MKISDITSYQNAFDLISDEYGIIQHLIGPIRQHSDPRVISYGVSTTNISALAKSGTYPHYFPTKIKSSGCGFDNNTGLMSTIGEVIERYCATIFDETNMFKTTYTEIEDKTINIDEYALFHPSQYKNPTFELKPFTPNTELTWTKTIDLTNGKEKLCPVQFIYLGYAKDINQINFPTSTGLAAHSDPYQAILNGLYESVERDSFTITWENNITPPKIKIDNTISEFIKQYFPINYEWHFFDMTFDIPLPTILCMCFGQSDFGEFVVVSAATRSDYSSAMKKAILEAGQGIPFLRWQLDERRDWHPKDYKDIHSFEEHPLFYQKRKENWSVFDKFRNAEPTQFHPISNDQDSLKDTKEEVNRILYILKNKGYNVLFKDLTTCDIKEKGFYVIRTYIPQLIQLGGVYPYYYRGGKRLYNIPVKYGYPPKDITKLNPFPHPFP